jgi:transcriptional regulator
MYVPSHFQLDEAAALAAVAARSAGTIVIAHNSAFEASLVPWLLEGDRLLGHVARPNPLTRLLAEPAPCIVLFDIVDAYVSPSFYPSKVEHGQVVPTWNYEAVHLHGTARAIDDPVWIRAQIEALTRRHEVDRPAPWSVDDAPDDYVTRLARGIVGIEVTVERVEGKAKLSQNKSDADRAGVVAGLASGAPRSTVLDLMRAT